MKREHMILLGVGVGLFALWYLFGRRPTVSTTSTVGAGGGGAVQGGVGAIIGSVGNAISGIGEAVG